MISLRRRGMRDGGKHRSPSQSPSSTIDLATIRSVHVRRRARYYFDRNKVGRRTDPCSSGIKVRTRYNRAIPSQHASFVLGSRRSATGL
jgi:hypothetical protein